MTGPGDSSGMVIEDHQEVLVHADGQVWAASWHAPLSPPDGRPHGATGVCVSGDGHVILVSSDGERWELPAGRPEADETWEETLRREMREETCATVRDARLLGFTRGRCIEGHERDLVLVRSVWRAEVELGAWDPQFEIPYRRVASADELESLLDWSPFAPLIRRALREAGVM